MPPPSALFFFGTVRGRLHVAQVTRRGAALNTTHIPVGVILDLVVHWAPSPVAAGMSIIPRPWGRNVCRPDDVEDCEMPAPSCAGVAAGALIRFTRSIAMGLS